MPETQLKTPYFKQGTKTRTIIKYRTVYKPIYVPAYQLTPFNNSNFKQNQF